MNVIVVVSHGTGYKAYFAGTSFTWVWGFSRVEAIGKLIWTYGRSTPLELAAMGLELKVLD